MWTVTAQSHSQLYCLCVVRVLGLSRPCEKSTVEAKACLPLLCKSEFWLLATYLFLEGNVWITECPFLLPVLSLGVCLFVILCCVSSYLSLSRNLGTAYVSQPQVTLADMHTYKAFSVLATRAALSAKNNNTMLLPFTMCNHEENYKKEM